MLPQIKITKKGLQQLGAGHLWVYRSDIETMPEAEAGIVDVSGPSGDFVGRALFAPQSQIVVRMLTRKATAIDKDFWRRRLRRAIDRRKESLPNVDACRLVHGEADLMPGIFIDRYGDAVAIQTTTAPADALEEVLVELVDDMLQPRWIVLRDDTHGRAREGLREHVTLVKGEEPVQVTYHEGDVAFDVDLINDQKTGSFLDQAFNHQRVASYAKGRGLDCFTYHGGFALQMAKGCDDVLALDSSEPALEAGRHAASTANIQNIQFLQADVMKLLPEFAQKKERFDTVVLDPPSFASTQKTVRKALGAYRELNKRAISLVNPDGILVSCSCSGRVRPDDFDYMLSTAARDMGRQVQILERWAAGPDHPTLMGMPETNYLKCRVLRVL